MYLFLALFILAANPSICKVLSLRNFTHQSATVQCHSTDSQQVIGGTTINTYSKPYNISCILHKKTDGIPDLLTCKWDHRIDPKLDVNYTVGPLNSSGQKEMCKTRETTCTVKGVSVLSDITITVRAKTADWEVDSDTHTFQPTHIWKMIPPRLKETSSFADHLLVEWDRGLIKKECRCEVKYNETKLNKALKEKEHGNMTIEQVESCSYYTVSVRCALMEPAPWSDWSQEKTVLTELNENNVRLRLWRKVAEPQKNGVRKVHAMWKDITSTCRGTFTYTIEPTPYKEAMMGGNYTETLCGKSDCDVEVNQDAHRLNLNMFHNETLLVVAAVHVPAIGESLPQVTDIQTSALEGVILVTWKAPIQPVSGYMIDWTHDGNQYYWKETNYTNATLSGLLDKKPYNVTVTPLFVDKTGHGTQALQICSRVGGPGNVTIHINKTNAKNALVSWNVKSQEECSGDVVEYIVFYRKLDRLELWLNVTVIGTEQAIPLEDLLPDTQYEFYVKATAATGTTKSTEMFFKTKRFGRWFITTLVVCGGVVIILVLSLGLGCAISWKKFREKPVPNPGCSSLALWPPREEGTGSIWQFNNPSESVCDRVYTEESQKTSTSPLGSGLNPYPAIYQTDEYIDPDMASAPETDPEERLKPATTQHHSSPNDSIEPLLPENNPSSPYRSQTSGENPGKRPDKQNKHSPVKQPDRKTPVMVYVTLDMFEQNQCR
ncbi:interleukin-31 receptor subunit alpha-like isoform X2 [Trematomus bernacchii]|uniref:interleukin-31 receptor subunit alpha-like isoform X2 n=1 Tax=Trematomus bernacchii TaxID=40690 RepID=UPI00146BA39B|nr:interleukin-31 receptor subunit alpha-like isoform X2 [Trematomus bernacchii]